MACACPGRGTSHRLCLLAIPSYGAETSREHLYVLTLNGRDGAVNVSCELHDGSAFTGGVAARGWLAAVPHRRVTRGPTRLRRASFVSMMQAADLRDRHDRP